MTTTRPRRATTQSEPNRISHLFWKLADEEVGSVLRDPEWVVKTWLVALDGLEGRRRDRETAQHALSFLMRLEKDPFYASPEQTRGGDRDSSGLVYSLALLLFERLTGHHPFVESLSPLECRIRRDRAKRVGTNNLCHLSPRLRSILHRALSPFSEDRYQDVATLRADIERWQRGEEPSLGKRPLEPSPSSKLLAQASSRGPRATPPTRRATQPPPPPEAGRRFVESDTLQGAVMVRSQAATTAAPRPSQAAWLWPALSASFALVALIALVVAFKSNSDAAPPIGARATATATSTHRTAPVATPPTSEPAPAPEAVMEFDESEAMPIEVSADEQTVARVRGCVSPDRLRGGLDIGISLLFDAQGVVTRSFTGKLGIPRAESQCIKSAVLGVTTGDPAQMGQIMRYDLYLASETDRVRVHPGH